MVNFLVGSVDVPNDDGMRVCMTNCSCSLSQQFIKAKLETSPFWFFRIYSWTVNIDDSYFSLSASLILKDIENIIFHIPIRMMSPLVGITNLSKVKSRDGKEKIFLKKV